MRIYIWIILPLLIIAVVFGCKDWRTMDGKGERERFETRNRLSFLCMTIFLVDDEPNVPVTMPEFVDWLIEFRSLEPGERNLEGVDFQQKTIRDAWGNPLVILSESGRFVGLGSAGPNEIWENGKGDDMIALLDEFRPE